MSGKLWEMIMRIMVLTAAAMLAAATAAHADDKYVFLSAGVDFAEDEDITGANAAGQPRDIDVAFDNGDYFSGGFGFVGKDGAYGRFRAEFEAAFRESKVESLALNGVDRAFDSSSEVSIASAMANAYWDSPTFYDRFRVYGGAGFGLAGVDHEIRYLVANASATNGNLQIIIPSSETTYAYQVMAGAELALTPRFSLTTDVRYFDVGDVQVERYIGNTIINGTATSNGTLDSVLDAELQSLTATFGVRFAF